MTGRPDSGPPDLAEVRRVERAAAVLTPLERDVLVLSAGRHLRTGEIAARLGIPQWRAERLLARALRKFDRAMDQQRRPWWRFW